MVKRVKKRLKRSIKTRKTKTGMPYSAKEKLLLAVFLMFSILAITVLFRAQTPTLGSFTGAATLSSTLSQNSFDPNDYLEGNIQIGLQKEDILPEKTEITYRIIAEDAKKCSENYVCPNGKTVAWHTWNVETQECEVEEIDPMTMCCRRYPSSCNQVLLDSGFERSGYRNSLGPDWYFDLTKVLHTAVGTEYGGAFFESEYAGYTNSLDAVYSAGEIYTEATIYQKLGDRKLTVCMPEEEPEIGGIATSSKSNNYEEGKELSFDTLSFADYTKKLEWAYMYDTYEDTCYFEVVLKTEQGRELHYYYYEPGKSGCSDPADGNNWIQIIPKFGTSNWTNESRHICSDWLGAFNYEHIDDVITEVYFISHGYKDENDDWAGQQVYWDNVRLTTSDTVSTATCSGAKKCCLEKTGYGDYYEQLDGTCEDGYECWSKCANSGTYTLKNFVSRSSTPGKNNRVEGHCQYVDSNSDVIKLDNECNLSGGVGKGYSACTDTSSTSEIHTCKNWNNIYEVDFDRLYIKGPAEEGTYSFEVSVAYMPTWYEKNCDPEYAPQYCDPILMYETSELFYIGEPPEPSTCPNSDYNITNSTNWTEWGDCIGGTQERTREVWKIYVGTEVGCEQTKIETETDSETCTVISNACEIIDWDCTPWDPTVCPSTGMQKRTCTLTGDCDSSDSLSYIPEEINYCTPSEKPSYTGWLVWGIIGLVILIVLIFVLQKFVMKPKRKKTIVYPELTSYIRDALTTGATKISIKNKLSKAGWPQNSINAAFRAVR